MVGAANIESEGAMCCDTETVLSVQSAGSEANVTNLRENIKCSIQAREIDAEVVHIYIHIYTWQAIPIQDQLF